MLSSSSSDNNASSKNSPTRRRRRRRISYDIDDRTRRREGTTTTATSNNNTTNGGRRRSSTSSATKRTRPVVSVLEMGGQQHQQQRPQRRRRQQQRSHDDDDDDERSSREENEKEQEKEEEELFVDSSSSDDDEDDEDDDEDVVLPRSPSSSSRRRTRSRKVNNGRSAAAAAASSSAIMDSGDDDDDASDDDASDDDRHEESPPLGNSTTKTSSGGRRSSTTRSSAQKAKSTMARISRDELEFGSDRDMPESEVEGLGLKDSDSDDSDSDDDDYSRGKETKKNKNKKLTRSSSVAAKKTIKKKKKTIKKTTTQQTKKDRPTKSTKRAANGTKKKKKSHGDDSDEEFDPDEDTDASSHSSSSDDEDLDTDDYDDDDSLVKDSDSDSDDHDHDVDQPFGLRRSSRNNSRSGKATKKSTGTKKVKMGVMNVDDEQIGTADEDSSSSDDDEDDGKKKVGSPKGRKATNNSEIRPSPRKGTFENSDLSSSSDDDDDDDDKNKTTTMGEWGRSSRNRQSLHVSHFCPSTEDAITAEELPEKHVCYVSPDGLSRQCFKIETLRHIALKSSLYNLRNDVDATRQNFLQPPHFRTPMSDDLVDQIASKFTRQALDLHDQSFWDGLKKKGRAVKTNMNSDDDDDGGSGHGGASRNHDDEEDIYDTFDDRLQSYFKSTMGSQDPYVCPLCYCQCYGILDKEGGSDSQEEDNFFIPQFRHDPMTILGCADDDEFVVASQFCFLKIADVKKHLRQIHNVDTSGVEGNSLYVQYRIRATDGLLQRWLKSSGGHASQGDMMKYWNQGSNQFFLLLLDLMKRARFYEQEVGYADDDDLSETQQKRQKRMIQFISQAEAWFDKGAHQTESRWLALAAPFDKSEDNIQDFIAEDDDLEEEEEQEDNSGPSHAELARKMAAADDEGDPNDFLSKIQRKYADDEHGSRLFQSDEEDDVGAGLENDNEEDVMDVGEDDEKVNDRALLHDGAYSEVESETDDWVKSKITPRKRKSSVTAGNESGVTNSGTKKNPPSSGSKVIGKRIMKRGKSLTSTTSSSSSTPRQAIQPVKRRTPAIQDSSDDE